MGLYRRLARVMKRSENSSTKYRLVGERKCGLLEKMYGRTEGRRWCAYVPTGTGQG